MYCDYVLRVWYYCACSITVKGNFWSGLTLTYTDLLRVSVEAKLTLCYINISLASLLLYYPQKCLMALLRATIWKADKFNASGTEVVCVCVCVCVRRMCMHFFCRTTVLWQTFPPKNNNKDFFESVTRFEMSTHSVNSDADSEASTVYHSCRSGREGRTASTSDEAVSFR